jgi:hypothetical protein
MRVAFRNRGVGQGGQHWRGLCLGQPEQFLARRSRRLQYFCRRVRGGLRALAAPRDVSFYDRADQDNRHVLGMGSQ